MPTDKADDQIMNLVGQFLVPAYQALLSNPAIFSRELQEYFRINKSSMEKYALTSAVNMASEFLKVKDEFTKKPVELVK